MFTPRGGLAPDPPDPSLPEPLHVQVAEAIRERIHRGDWPPGSRLLAEPELAAVLGISRGTVRRAISTLSEDGLLTQVQGRGTFVTAAGPRTGQAERLSTLSEDLGLYGGASTIEVLAAGLQPAPERIALRLGIQTGETVLALLRLRRLGGLPAAVLYNWVRAELTPGIENLDFGGLQLFEVLEGRYGLTIDSASRRFSAVAAQSEAAALLEIAVGSPLQHVEQVTSLTDGRSVEFSDIWIVSSLITITTRLPRQ
jgi:GntR family transcriptional regulator